ncbi:sugar ABC transporter permease [Intrasporangium oryzae NRRL B-24470]|uniref:Sugar ABC transporter permease n=1 Tax=Intrasporangium oryzae NRRL B-24470 TaxID=1386089 RepID=W9G7R4_9MICO|nr:sugar ABC transporter permease [Intrasporangium oryzae]EWT02050.1 sugar ABC transporter permease [Intrasporangium oryzae NRRL B-24470]
MSAPQPVIVTDEPATGSGSGGPRAESPAPAALPARAKRRGRRVPLLLIVPTLALLVVALGYPVCWQLATSFKHFGMLQQFGQPPEWVGLDNYKAIVTDPDLWAVVARSIAFCLVSALTTVAIGGGLALLMQAVGRVTRIILQLALLLAWAMPVVASMTVWVWLVDWRRGLLNWLLVRLGVDAEGHNWLAEPLSFFVVAAVIVVWMSVPFVALSIYAGLTQVSTEVLEAAQIDGAGGWQRLRYIIVPLIAPVLSIVLLLQLIWDLRVFTQIKILQDAGGVANETDLLGTFVYRLGTGAGDFGTASAVSVFMLALTVALSWYYVRSIMKEES